MNPNPHDHHVSVSPRRPWTSSELWGRPAAARGLFVGVLGGLFACSSGSIEDGERSLRQGLTRMEALAGEGEFDDALAVSDRLLAPDPLSGLRMELESFTRGASEWLLGPVTGALDTLGIDAMTAEERGEVHFARALTLLGSSTELEGEEAGKQLERARASLEEARRAGGGVALSAVEALGDLILAGAEAKRLEIPELGGGAPAGPVAPGPAASAPTGSAPTGSAPSGSGASAMAAKDDRDPLEEARKLYVAAQLRFVERLALEGRVDGGGASDDVRANAELVTRRLRELDEIQRQREEQEQQDDEQQKSDEKSESDDEQQDDEEPEDADQDESKPEDSESEEPKDESPEENPEEDSDENGEEPEDAEPPTPEDEASDASEEEAEPREITEVELTAEEQQRLMERNRAYQEEGDRRRRILLGRRRGNGKRDW